MIERRTCMYEAFIDLWYGNVIPCEMRMKKNETEKSAVELMERYLIDLNNKMDEEGRALLIKFDNCHGELLQKESEDAFIKGFSLGVKLMAEVFFKE